MGEMGFQVVPQGQAQAEMEINDFILEDEIKDVSEDEAVVIVEWMEFSCLQVFYHNHS